MLSSGLLANNGNNLFSPWVVRPGWETVLCVSSLPLLHRGRGKEKQSGRCSTKILYHKFSILAPVTYSVKWQECINIYLFVLLINWAYLSLWNSACYLWNTDICVLLNIYIAKPTFFFLGFIWIFGGWGAWTYSWLCFNQRGTPDRTRGLILMQETEHRSTECKVSTLPSITWILFLILKLNFTYKIMCYT